MKKINITKYVVASIIMLLLIVLSNKVQAQTATVTADTLNLRSEASTDSSIVKLLNQGEELDVISDEGDWLRVSSDGTEGYVSKDYVQVNEETVNTTPETPTETPTQTPTTENPSETGTGTTVVTSKVNQDTQIRILPLINSNVLENISSGATVTIITSTNKWTFVETDTISGWILNSALEENTTSTSDNQTTGNTDNGNTNNTSSSENNDTTNQSSDTMYDTAVTKYINGSSVYIRNEPSTDASIVISLIRNTDVTVTGENGDWYKVKYGDFEGYIFKELLSDEQTEQTNRHMPLEETTNLQENAEQTSNSNESSLGQEIVEYAKQYLGYPYVYGGAGSSSFDCSGFTMYVYKNFGYSLSHSARAQSKMGTYVEKENLQPGDLVFFLDYETMDDIGHCGIYIGDGNFIHASSGTGYCVKISTLLSGSYDRRYATARRLI